MKWSYVRPSKEGTYYWQSRADQRPILVELGLCPTRGWCWVGSVGFVYRESAGEHNDGRWFGPLPEPNRDQPWPRRRAVTNRTPSTVGRKTA